MNELEFLINPSYQNIIKNGQQDAITYLHHIMVLLNFSRALTHGVSLWLSALDLPRSRHQFEPLHLVFTAELVTWCSLMCQARCTSMGHGWVQ